MKQIRNEYKGKVLSNRKVPYLIVDEIHPNDYNYYIKMGFEFIFTDVITKPIKKTKKTKNDTTSSKSK
jgi:hypothetical protein